MVTAGSDRDQPHRPHSNRLWSGICGRSTTWPRTSIGPSGVSPTTIPWWPPTMRQPGLSWPSGLAWVPDASRPNRFRLRLNLPYPQKDAARWPP